MFKKIRRIFIIFVFCLVSILMIGCTQSAEPQEIVIGVAWPFADNNDLFNEGIDLAVKEINESGGIKGQDLRLLKADDSSEVVKGIAIAESFAENKSVRAVIGHRNSFVSIPASATYEQAGLVMLSPASTAPKLTQNQYRHIFRNIPSDTDIARQLANYLVGQGYRRMVIYYSSDDYGSGLANSFEDQAKSLGITIVDRFNYYSGTEDLKRLHNKWRAFGFDGIFIASSMSGGAQFISDAGEAGINGPFVAGNTLDSPQLAEIGEKVAEKTIVGSVFKPNSERPEVISFVTAFREVYQETPGSYAALGYDAVKILATVMEKTNEQDRASIADGLRNLGRWQGVCGFHEFSSSGDDLSDLVVLKQLQDGKFVYLEK